MKITIFDFNVGIWLFGLYERLRFHIYMFCLRLRQQENYIQRSKGLLKKKQTSTIGPLFVSVLTVIQKVIQ